MKSTLAALTVLALLAAPADAASRRQVGGSWDGRWAGAWGGNDPTAVIIKGNRVVAYEYGGSTNPVEHSQTTGNRIVYGEADIVVTLTRTGTNSAHATIKSGQGTGTAELVRK